MLPESIRTEGRRKLVGLVHDEEASEVVSRGLWEWEIALKNLRRGILIVVGIVDLGFVVYWIDFFVRLNRTQSWDAQIVYVMIGSFLPSLAVLIALHFLFGGVELWFRRTWKRTLTGLANDNWKVPDAETVRRVVRGGN